MNSLMNSLNCGSANGSIEPAMHIINSLGPKKSSVANLTSSSGYFSVAAPSTTNNYTATDNTLASLGYQSPLDFLESLKYNTAYSPKAYQPTGGPNLSSFSSKSGYSGIDPVGYGKMRSYSQPNQSGNKSGEMKPDENNNFMRDQRGRFALCGERMSDGEPNDRIRQLAQPKRVPSEYQEDRRSVYWGSKRLQPNCGNHTHFETTPRLDELAMPKVVKDGLDCCRSCQGEPAWCYHPCPEKDSRCIDWSRLAAPKQRPPLNYRPLQHVRKSALKGEATKRLCRLSIPKPAIDVGKFYLWLWKKKPDTAIKLTKVQRLTITKCQMADMRVMIRCDLNPFKGAGIEEKMMDVVPTIKYALEKGAKSVIIVSNCPAPGGDSDVKAPTLKHLAPQFEKLIGTPVLFLDDCVGYQARALCRDPEQGNVFLLENLAFHPEESGTGKDENGKVFTCSKEKIEAFRNEFFHLADTYVIDSFMELTSMTNTTVGYPNQEKAYGFKLKREVTVYNSFVYKPRQPMLAIVGGALKDTYLIIRNLMGIASDILVAGESSLVFLKALKRTELGSTIISPKMEVKALHLHSRAKDTKTGLLLPSDVVVRSLQTGKYFTVLTRDDVEDDYEIVDIGPFTRKCYVRMIEKAATLLWWGDIGSLGDGTEVIAEAFVRAAQNGAHTFVAYDSTKSNIINSTDMGLKTRVTEDTVATTMLLKGKMPKGLSVLNQARRKIKKREPAAPPVSRKPIKYDVPGLEISSGDKFMCISDVPLEGKNVLIRADFNVLIRGNKVTNNYRIRMIVPTIKYALKWGARTVVLLGSMGYPGGTRDDALSLKPVCDELASLLRHTVVFVHETVGKIAETAISNAHPGTVIMLENPGLMWKTTQQMSEASPQVMAQFCEKITRLGDVFVNDAFSCLNYDHSSVMGYLLPTRVCGFLVKNELKYLAKICNYPQRRLLIILGGKSFREKMPILKDLLKEADDLILVGALAVAFLKVYLNISVGSSVYETTYEEDIKHIIDLSTYYSCRLFYPVDLVIASNRNGDNSKHISITEPIPDNQMVVDIGELSSSMFGRIVLKSKMVFWVGVAGITEIEVASKGTKKIMSAIIQATKDTEKNVISIVGGHSISEYITKFVKKTDSFTHVTTGSFAAFHLLTERYLLAMDNLMPKPGRRPFMMLGVDQVDVMDKRILTRADLEVPVVDGKVVDTIPLMQLAQTIRYLLRKGARCVTVLGTRGEPNGKVDPELSLLPLKAKLESLVEQEVFFAEEGVSASAEAATKSKKVVLVENIKFHPEEEGVKDGPNNWKIKVSYDVMDVFRATLTSLGDIFMNDSMSSLNLNHCSVVGVNNIRKVAGPNVKKNILKLEEIKKTMERPLLAILAGDVPKDDLVTLYKIMDLVDDVIICGNLALTFLKSEIGAHLGNATIDMNGTNLLPKIIMKAKMNKINLHLPLDYMANEDPGVQKPEEVVSEKRDDDPDQEEVEPEPPKEERQTLFTVNNGIPDDLLPLDIGPETSIIFNDIITEAKTIILQGTISPYYKYESCQAGSKAVFEAIRNTVANGGQSVAIGMKTVAFVNHLEAVDAFTLCTNGAHTFYDIIRGRPLPGLSILEMSPPKPLKKLTLEQMDVTNKRVLMRLDLTVPTVEGVVLDTDKLELAAPTILYALKKGAKCVIIMGHRGNPNGYKNTYLSMQPLIVDFSQILQTPVTMINRPCSRRTKLVLADPPPGSVFLMENLKFYPAEYGQDVEAHGRDSLKGSEMSAPAPAPTEEHRMSQVNQGSHMELHEAVEVEEDSGSTPSPLTLSDGDGGKNIDSLMFQLMTPKTVAQFTEDLSRCGDVYVNDDVSSVTDTLTSLQGFNLEQKACGLLLAAYLSDIDDPEVYNIPTIAALSPAPR